MPLGPKPSDDKVDDPKKKDPAKDGHISDLFAHALGTPSQAKTEPAKTERTEVAKADPAKPEAAKPKTTKPHEEISTFGVVREFGSGLLNSALGVASLGDRHKSADQILRNDNSGAGGTIGAIATNLWNVASNPVQTAKGIYHASESAVHTVAHGTWQERTQLASGAAFNIGLLGLGGAGTASRMATRTETLAMGEKAASSTVVARSALGDFSTKAAGLERAGVEASAASRLIPKGLKSTVAGETGLSSILRPAFTSERPAMAAFMDTRSLATRFEPGTATIRTAQAEAGTGVELTQGAHVQPKVVEPINKPSVAESGAKTHPLETDIKGALTGDAAAKHVPHAADTTVKPVARAGETELTKTTGSADGAIKPHADANVQAGLNSRAAETRVEQHNVGPVGDSSPQPKVEPTKTEPNGQHQGVIERDTHRSSDVKSGVAESGNVVHIPDVKPVHVEPPVQSAHINDVRSGTHTAQVEAKPLVNTDRALTTSLEKPAVPGPELTDLSGSAGAYINIRSLRNQVNRDASLVGEKIASLDAAEVRILEPLKSQVEKTVAEPSAASLRKLSDEMAKPEVSQLIERNPQLNEALRSFKENTTIMTRPVETSAERTLVNVQEMRSSIPALKEPLQAVEDKLAKIVRESDTSASSLTELQRVSREFDQATSSLASSEPRVLELKQNLNNVLRTHTEQVLHETALSMTDNIAQFNRVLASEPALAQDLGLLQKIESGLKDGRLDSTTAGKQVDEIVRRVEKTESSRALDPHAVELLKDLKIEARALAAAPVDMPVLTAKVGRDAAAFSEGVGALGADGKALSNLNSQIEQLAAGRPQVLKAIETEIARPEVAAVLERNPALKNLLGDIRESGRIIEKPVETSAVSAVSHVDAVAAKLGAEPFQAVRQNLDIIAREGATPARIAELERSAVELESLKLPGGKGEIASVRQSIENVVNNAERIVPTQAVINASENLGTLARALSTSERVGPELGQLQRLETALKDGKLDTLPNSIGETRKLVATLEEPRYAEIFAEKPEAARALQELKNSPVLKEVAESGSTVNSALSKTTAAVPVDLPALTAKVGRDAAAFSEGVGALGAEGKTLSNLEGHVEQLAAGRTQALKAIETEIARPEVAAVLERNPALKNLLGDIRESGRIIEKPVETSAVSAVSHVDAVAAKYGSEPFQTVRQNLDIIAREGATPARIAELERSAVELESLKLPGGKGEIAAVRQSIENVVTNAERIVPTQAVINASENLGTLARTLSTSEGMSSELGQLKRLETALKEGKLDTLPDSIAETRKLVTTLEEPRYAEIFAQKPEAARALQELKNSPALKELAESGNTVNSALARSASEVMPKLETLTGAVSPELAPALKPIEDGLRTLSKEYTPEAAQNLSRAMQDFEVRSAGQLSPIARDALTEVRAGVDRVISEGAERSAVATLENNLQTVSSETAVVRANTTRIGELLRETPVISPVENRIVESLGRNVQKLEATLERPLTTATAATTAREVEQLVRELERPEFSRFFAENPRLARALDELKTSSETLGSSVARVESQALTVERVQAVNTFKATTESALTRTETILNSGSAELKIAGVTDDVKGFVQDINALKAGAGSDAALASLRNRVENLERLGAGQTARELAHSVNELESQATIVARAQRIEASAVAVERESAAVSTQSQNLARSFSDEANLAPSRGVGQSVQAQVAENLDFIGRQSRVLANVEADVQSVAKIKEALNRVEELSAGGKVTFTGERRAMFEELKESVARLDKAAVEAQGLRVVEDSAVRIVREGDKLNLLAERLGDNVALGEGVSRSVGAIRSNAGELTAGATIETQSQAVARIMHELDDPTFAQALRRSREGANLYTELKNTASSLDDAVKLRSLEQSSARIEGQVQHTAEVAGNMRALVNDGQGSVSAALLDYENAARRMSSVADRGAIARMDESLATIKREIGDHPSFRSLESAHESLKSNLVYVDETARQLIQNRLPQVESYFTQLAKADSSAVQREIIRQASQEVQTLRYLEQHTSLNGAGQLELAQGKLVSAANDLEVAAYRRNLLRLAAEGVKGASDKFLLAGLTSEGFKATTMARSLSSPLSNFADVVRIHARLLPVVGGENGALLRSLSANDALFANNRSLLFSPENIRYGSAALMATSVGTLYYSSRLDGDVKVGENRFTVSPSDQIASSYNAAPADVSRQAIPSSTAISNGGQFSPIGQDVVRSAYAHDLHLKAVNPTTFASAPSESLVAAAPANSQLSAPVTAASNQSKPVEYVAGHPLSVDDPNFNQKYTWLQTYGVSFAPSLKSESATNLGVVAPLVTAQSLNIRPGTIIEPAKPFEKPANDRFVMPTAMTLNSPLSLLGGNQGQRRDLSVRGSFLNSGAVAQGNSQAPAGESVALAAGLQHEAETEAGSNGVKNMQGMEETENGLDHAAGGGVVAQAAVDPDNDDEDGKGGATNVTAPQSPVQARPIIPGPPRKKSTQIV